MTGSGQPAPLAIIGGGAAGAWLLVMIEQAGGLPEGTVVIEPRAQIGLGIAYSATLDVHRLNVTADKMDMHPVEGVETFVEWLARRTQHRAEHHVPRRLYGEYFSHVLATTLGGAPVRHLRDRATSVLPRDGIFEIALSKGERLLARRVVLALGNPASRRLWPTPASTIAEDPFAGRLAELGAAQDVLVVGAGLTAIDAILELEAIRAGRRYHVVAPHPFFPPSDAAVPEIEDELAGSMPPSALWRWARARRSVDEGLRSWYGPIDALRPHARAIWRSWTPALRASFLRHGMRRWLHLRHRAAPQAAAQISAIEADGRLRMIKGRASILSASQQRVEVMLAGLPASFDGVVNATGPDLNPRHEPLLAGLLAAGLARPDPLGLGISVADDGTLLATAGERVEGLHALGVWTRGTFWEVVAVPHIREAAAAMLPSLLRKTDR